MANILLTRLECKQILAAVPKFALQLKDYDVEPALEAKGFLGEYHRLTMTCYEPDKGEDKSQKDKTIVMKFFLKSLPKTTAEPEIIAIFQKEIKLYTNLLKELQKYSATVWCPQMYYSRKDLLVIQDLTTLGFEKCQHSHQNLNESEMKALLKTLAIFHSSSIVHEVNIGRTLDKQYSADLFHEISVAPHVLWFTTGLRAIICLSKNHPAYLSKEMQHFIDHKLEARLTAVYEMQNPSKNYRNVLCHRDPWQGNFLFNFSDMTAALVDFQTCRYIPPCIDVILAIFMNSDIETRKSNERKYLTWYYEQFKEALAESNIEADIFLPLEEFLRSYEEFIIFGYLYRAMAGTVTHVPRDLVTDEYKLVERSKPLLKFMESDQPFRLYMESCIGDLLDYVVNSFEKI